MHFPGKSHLQCLLHLNAVLVPRTTSLPTHLVYYLPGLLSHWNLNPASWWQSPHCFPVCPTTTSQWHWTLKNPSFGPTPLQSHCLLPSFTLSRWKYPFIFHLHFHLSLPVNLLHLLDSLHSSQTLLVKVPGTLHLINPSFPECLAHRQIQHWCSLPSLNILLLLKVTSSCLLLRSQHLRGKVGGEESYVLFWRPATGEEGGLLSKG